MSQTTASPETMIHPIPSTILEGLITHEIVANKKINNKINEKEIRNYYENAILNYKEEIE